MPERSKDGKLLVLGCLLYTAGSAIQYLSPAYLADLGHRMAIEEAQMGSLSAAENLGIGLASVLALWWNGRFDRRIITLLAVLTCVVGDIASFFCGNFDLLLLLRGVTATFGEGTLFAMAFATMANAANPHRLLGFALSSVVVFTSAVLSAAPILDRVPIGSGWLLPLVAVSCAVLPAIRWMPEAPLRSPQQTPQAGNPGIESWLAVIALLGLTIWGGAPSSFWVFAADVAQAHHFSAAEIGGALAAGNVLGLLGSALAAWQGNRWRRTGPILIGSACLVASAAGAQIATDITMLTAMLAALNIFWNYTIVYEMSLVVALDRTGKVATGISGGQMAGFAAGAFVAGHAIVAGGFFLLTPLVAAFAAGGLLLFAVCRYIGSASVRTA